MRDPNRIHKIILRFEELWRKNPDLRFMQLINNIQYSQGSDMFYTEDDELFEIIEKFDDALEARKEIKKHKIFKRK